jgi:hypothetical protein
MQSCASAAKLEAADPLFPSACAPRVIAPERCAKLSRIPAYSERYNRNRPAKPAFSMDGPRTTLIRDNLTNGDAMNLSAGPRYQP